MTAPPEAPTEETAREPTVLRSAASGGAFAIINAAQRALVFLLLPVYTSVLSPSEYGALGLLITVQSAAVLLFQGGMEAAIMRHFFTLDGDRPAQYRFVGSSWRFLIVVAPTLALLGSAGLLLFTHESGVYDPSNTALALFSASAFVAATVAPLTLLRAEQRLVAYAVVMSAVGLVTTALTVIAVVALDTGVAGWFVAATISNGIVLLVAMRAVPWRRIDHFDRPGVRTALLLGLSLVPHALSLWALSLADRIVLASLLPAAQLGVYTLAANLAIPAMVIIQSLNQGFLPAYARAQHDEHRSSLRQIVSLQVILVTAVGLSVSVLAIPVIGLLKSSYHQATEIVPWLVLGGVFWGYYQLPMNIISMVAGRTQKVWMIGLSAAGLGIGSLVVFVPKYGLDAAGPASALGYLLLFIFTIVYLRALRWRLPIAARPVAMALAIAGGAYVISDELAEFGIAAFAERGVLVLGALVAMGLCAGIRPRHLAAALRRFKR